MQPLAVHDSGGLFRYELIQDVIDPALSTRQRGRRAREVAGTEHAGLFGEKIRLSRNTIDRWARWENDHPIPTVGRGYVVRARS